MKLHDNPVVEKIVGEPRLTVVLAHGRQRSPAFMTEIAERLGVEDVRYLFPVADDNSWFPQNFLAPVEQNEPYLTLACLAYERIVGGLIEAGTPADRIVIGGFSQGACLTAAYMYCYPRRYGGVVLWTGGLCGPDGTLVSLQPELAGVPVYLTTSEDHPAVPAWRVRQTEKWLRACGATTKLRIFASREHVIEDEEIDAARELIVAARDAATVPA